MVQPGLYIYLHLKQSTFKYVNRWSCISMTKSQFFFFLFLADIEISERGAAVSCRS